MPAGLYLFCVLGWLTLWRRRCARVMLQVNAERFATKAHRIAFLFGACAACARHDRTERLLIALQESFFGKLLLHLVVFAILLIRNTDDVAKYKNLFDEATFYDKQWNATWEGQVRLLKLNEL